MLRQNNFCKSWILQRKKSTPKFFHVTIFIKKADDLIIKLDVMLNLLLIWAMSVSPPLNDSKMEERDEHKFYVLILKNDDDKFCLIFPCFRYAF